VKFLQYPRYSTALINVSLRKLLRYCRKAFGFLVFVILYVLLLYYTALHVLFMILMYYIVNMNLLLTEKVYPGQVRKFNLELYLHKDCISRLQVFSLLLLT